MVRAGEQNYLIVGARPLLWSFDGYYEASLPLADPRLITPPSTMRALQAGYRVKLHEKCDDWILLIQRCDIVSGFMLILSHS